MALSAAALVAAGAIISCGGGRSDEDALTDLLRGFFAALDSNASAAELAGFYSRTCTSVAEQFEEGEASRAALARDADFEVTGVEVRNRQDDSAEVRPLGRVIFRGGDQPFGDEFVPVMKEDGQWKIGQCVIAMPE